MSLYHLGNRVSALVDGQLAPEAAERALAHAAACPECRDALDAERAARRALHAAGDLEPSDALTGRLLALCGTEPGAAHPSGMAAPTGVPLPRSHRPARWLLAGAGTAAAAVGGLVALGSVGTPVLDPADLRAAAVLPAVQGADELDVPVGERTADPTDAALAWLREEGWVAPSVVPPELAVVGIEEGADEVAVELVGDGARVVVTERHGRLAPPDPDAERVVVGETEAVLLRTAPWTAAVQSGDVVVVVVGEGDPSAGLAVLAGLPVATPATDGALARFGRGWDVLQGSVRRALAGLGAPS